MDAELERTLARAGRKLAEMSPRQRAGGPTATIGTIKAVHEYGGTYTADVTVRGADLLGLSMTTGCVLARVGDKCVIETFGHFSFVTGILAKPGAWTPETHTPMLTWTSTWSGKPANEPSTGYVELTRRIHLPHPTTLLCEVGAAIAGTGEYAMSIEFAQSGTRKALASMTSPQKNGGTLRWTALKTLGLPAGDYDVTVTTYHWGSVEIIGTDSSGNSKRWIDPSISAAPIFRYAKIIAL